MQHPITTLTRSNYFLFGLFAVAFLLCLFNAWGYPIFIVDEARNSACAMEMFQSHHWFLPTYNYTLRTDKPPLHYFFMMLAYKSFGINVFGARFFSALFGASTITLVYHHTKKWLGDLTAFWSAFILLVSIHFIFESHLGVPDPYLIFFFTATCLYFYKGIQSNSLRDFLWMYLFMALGFLSKGPIAILLPSVIFLIYLLITKRLSWSQIAQMKPLVGLLIVLVITVPWFVINGLQTDWTWTQGFFLKHNVGRFSQSMEGHHGPFFLPTLYILLGLFPFSFILPQAISYLYQRRHRLHNYRLNYDTQGGTGFLLFSIIAAAVVLVFFSISHTKLIHYTLPTYPFLAILIGFYLAQPRMRFYNIRASYWISLLIALLIPIAANVGMQLDPSLAPIHQYALWLIILPAGILVAFFLRHDLYTHLTAVGITTTLTSLVFFGILAPKIGQQDPVQQTLPALQDRPVGHVGRFAAAYPFYLRRPIIDVAPGEISSFFARHPDGILIGRRRAFQHITLTVPCDTIYLGKDIFEETQTLAIALRKHRFSTQAHKAVHQP